MAIKWIKIGQGNCGWVAAVAGFRAVASARDGMAALYYNLSFSCGPLGNLIGHFWSIYDWKKNQVLFQDGRNMLEMKCRLAA